MAKKKDKTEIVSIYKADVIQYVKSIDIVIKKVKELQKAITDLNKIGIRATITDK